MIELVVIGVSVCGRILGGVGEIWLLFCVPRSITMDIDFYNLK